MKEIAILITSFNRKSKTLQCLETLYLQKDLNNSFRITIFLVDDGCSDGTAEAIADKFPGVDIIKGSGDLFWNRGMHLAWCEALKHKIIFDYFLWLNDDVVLYDDAISHILTCDYESESKAIICGILETSQFSAKISYGGGCKVNGIYHSNQPSDVLRHCDIINGNFVLIPRTVFDAVGVIDPLFPHGLGDHDYGLRSKKLGYSAYTTKQFIGYCKLNLSKQKWCLPEVKLKNRIRSLYSPLGSHPYYYFIYEYRHYGVYTAVKHLLSVHLRVLLPQLWK